MTTENRAAADSGQTPYEAAVIEQLRLEELATLGADRAARVVLMPWFARDVAITVWARGLDAWLEVRALPIAGRRRAIERSGLHDSTVVVWSREPRRAPPLMDPRDLDPAPRWVELPLAASDLAALWERLRRLDRSELRAPRMVALDGMSVTATIVEPGGATESFRLWSPARQSAGGVLVESLLELAMTRVRDSQLAAVLARADTYVW